MAIDDSGSRATRQGRRPRARRQIQEPGSNPTTPRRRASATAAAVAPSTDPKNLKEIGPDNSPGSRDHIPNRPTAQLTGKRTDRGLSAPRPTIVMRPGYLKDIVDEAQAALQKAPVRIYQRGGTLVHPITVDVTLRVTSLEGVRRAAGMTILAPVSEAWLLEQMSRSALWVRGGTTGKVTVSDPSSIYARTLLSRGEWAFPALRGIIKTPIVTRDGRIVEAPGLDRDTGLLLDFAPGEFPSVPVSPSKDDARVAFERLARPLRGFPFVNDAARSVALSAVLTALVRPILRTAPLHGFDAPTAGTGKSLLAELVGLLATGCLPPALSQGKSAEEDEKRLSTVLFAGDPVIHIDNCECPISGDFLCSTLTQEVVQARILGKSERRVVPVTALVLASGNNLTLAGDAARRAVICRLDARVERPDTRAFDFDCHAEVLASRPSLVVDALTILRAYRLLQSDESVALPPMGSFSDWEWIRGALVWLDCSDPAETRSDVFDAESQRSDLLAVMTIWERAIGAESVQVGQIGTPADMDGAPNALIELRDKLIEVACRDGWNSRSVGWWLRRHKDRVVDGRVFQSDAGDSHQRWRLVRGSAVRPGD